MMAGDRPCLLVTELGFSDHGGFLVAGLKDFVQISTPFWQWGHIRPSMVCLPVLSIPWRIFGSLDCSLIGVVSAIVRRMAFNRDCLAVLHSP